MKTRKESNIKSARRVWVFGLALAYRSEMEEERAFRKLLEEHGFFQYKSRFASQLFQLTEALGRYEFVGDVARWNKRLNSFFIKHTKIYFSAIEAWENAEKAYGKKAPLHFPDFYKIQRLSEISERYRLHISSKVNDTSHDKDEEKDKEDE